MMDAVREIGYPPNEDLFNYMIYKGISVAVRLLLLRLYLGFGKSRITKGEENEQHKSQGKDIACAKKTKS